LVLCKNLHFHPNYGDSSVLRNVRRLLQACMAPELKRCKLLCAVDCKCISPTVWKNWGRRSDSFGLNTSGGKGKAVQLQAWTDPEGSKKLRYPDVVTTAHDGGEVVNPTPDTSWDRTSDFPICSTAP